MTTHPDLTTAAAYLDEAMKAIALAKQALLGGAGGALFVSSGPDLAEAEASTGNPYGSTKHGEFTAGSAAEVAEGVPGWDDPLPGEAAEGTEPTQCPDFCMAATPTRYGHATVCCTLPAGHDGDHVARGTGNPPGSWAEGGGIDWEALERVQGFAQDLCPAQWGEPPETMLCSLSSGHDGNHATAEGIEWGGRWETAEPHGGAR